jgi:hypothetical protein
MRTRDFDGIPNIHDVDHAIDIYRAEPGFDGAGVEEDLADWAGCDWRRPADGWRRCPIGTLSSSERV